MVNQCPDQAPSFYGGQPFVCLKDAIFQPSSAIRHGVELMEVLSGTSYPANRPVMMMYTDGGPDHRTTFISVQLAYVAIFLNLDLDAFIVLRTPPNLSVLNPAERVMSLLNVALYGIALSRETLSTVEESAMKRYNTKKQWRNGVTEVILKSTWSMLF